MCTAYEKIYIYQVDIICLVFMNKMMKAKYKPEVWDRCKYITAIWWKTSASARGVKGSNQCV